MLTDLINRSQEAVGALQAAQATNQLLALQARQMIQAQQLALSQDRAEALEHGRVLGVCPSNARFTTLALGDFAVIRQHVEDLS